MNFGRRTRRRSPEMENVRSEQDSKPFPIGVFEIPGEPAIIINGVPDEPKPDDDIVISDAQSHHSVGCGEWLEGREVRKLFLGHYYSGKVLKFDKETGWYRVEYEDGDSEDLDWHELEEVLLPLDVTIPLKSLASHIARSRQQPTKSMQTGNVKTKISQAKRLAIESGQDSVTGQSDGSEL